MKQHFSMHHLVSPYLFIVVIRTYIYFHLFLIFFIFSRDMVSDSIMDHEVNIQIVDKKNGQTVIWLYQQLRHFTQWDNINVIFTLFMDTNQNQARRIVSINNLFLTWYYEWKWIYIFLYVFIFYLVRFQTCKTLKVNTRGWKMVEYRLNRMHVHFFSFLPF